MAILANLDGTIISVIETDKPFVWKENCPNGSLFNLKPEQAHRKVFTGPDCVDDAITWILATNKKQAEVGI